MSSPMPMPLHMQRTRTPHLPREITDAIIDFLHNDIQALGICSTVCSDWLTRSRHHLFSTVHLWPWRVSRFLTLATSPQCTFSHHITRIELDDAQTSRNQPSGSQPPTGMNRAAADQQQQQVLFSETISHSHLPCLSHTRSLLIHNADWTLLTPPQQTLLRTRLAQFTHLLKLELHNVIFHDLREVVRIVETLPRLEHLTADVGFMKYMEHTVASAAKLRLPSHLKVIDVGSEEGIPVVLACLGAREGESHVVELKLRNVRFSHLPFVRLALEKGRKNVRHVSLGFAEVKEESMGPDDSASILDFARLSHLRTLRISGLRIPKVGSSLSVIERTLAAILSTIESSFLETITLEVNVEDINNLEAVDWRQLERVLLALLFFGMNSVHVVIDHGTEVEGELVEAKIRSHVPDLSARGALMVHHPSKAAEKVPVSCQGDKLKF